MPTPNIINVLTHIFNAVEDGELPQESELTEGTIARQLRLSRSTVRLALSIIALVQESSPILTYRRPHGPQNSVVVFGTRAQHVLSEGNQKPVPKQSQLQHRKTTAATDDEICCPRCNSAYTWNYATQMVKLYGKFLCEECNFPLTDLVE